MPAPKCKLDECHSVGFQTADGYCSPFHAQIGKRFWTMMCAYEKRIEARDIIIKDLEDRLRASHARETNLNRRIFDTTNQIQAILRGNTV